MEKEYEINYSLENNSVARSYNPYSISAVTGDNSTAEVKDYGAIACNTGEWGKICTSGRHSIAVSTGDNSCCSADREESIAIAMGVSSTVKGVIGSYLVLTEYKFSDDTKKGNFGFNMCDAKIVKVDGEVIKANTEYALLKGKIVEAKAGKILRKQF